jgi:autotransporter passenger strand-loop-strand repeat protein
MAGALCTAAPFAEEVQSIRTTINAGCVQNVESGGSTSGNFAFNEPGTTINSRGVQNVESGGTAQNTTINDGGLQNVESGGRANGTTINSGSLQDVSGTAYDTVINSGGVENVNSVGTAIDVSFGANGTLDLATPSGLQSFRDWQAGDVIDFLKTDVMGFSLSFTGPGNGSLTVFYDGTQTTYSFLGASTSFKLQSDGHGGMELIGNPVSTVGVPHHEAAIHFGHGAHF